MSSIMFYHTRIYFSSNELITLSFIYNWIPLANLFLFFIVFWFLPHCCKRHNRERLQLNNNIFSLFIRQFMEWRFYKTFWKIVRIEYKMLFIACILFQHILKLFQVIKITEKRAYCLENDKSKNVFVLYLVALNVLRRKPQVDETTHINCSNFQLSN